MTTKSVILIDFDNIFLTLWRFDQDLAVRFGDEPTEWLQALTSRHLSGDHRRWLVARCYLNPAGWVSYPDPARPRLYMSRFRPNLVRAGFEVIDCPSMTGAGKNAADIRIVIDALDLLRADCRYDEFIIGSADADFAPLLQRLRANDRRVIVMTPGYASAAYTSLADQIIDATAIDALVRPEPVATPEQIVEDERSAGDISAAFADHVRNRYLESSAHLNMASLAQEVGRLFPTARETNWFGTGSFSAAVDRLALPHAKRTAQILWDEERHQPPVGADRSFELNAPDDVVRLMRLLEMPRLARDRWPSVFEILARYAAEHEFNLTESTRWSRDELERLGAPVGRPALSYVVRGTGLGGAPLNRDPPPMANEIARAFYDSLIKRARATGIELNEDGEGAVADWLGIGRSP